MKPLVRKLKPYGCVIEKSLCFVDMYTEHFFVILVTHSIHMIRSTHLNIPWAGHTIVWLSLSIFKKIWLSSTPSHHWIPLYYTFELDSCKGTFHRVNWCQHCQLWLDGCAVMLFCDLIIAQKVCPVFPNYLPLFVIYE